MWAELSINNAAWSSAVVSVGLWPHYPLLTFTLPAGASATCAHILYSRRTHGVLALAARRGVRPAATYWTTPHAGGETVDARLWLLTPYKTLLCTALCNVVLSSRLAAPALPLCNILFTCLGQFHPLQSSPRCPLWCNTASVTRALQVTVIYFSETT